mmetsp:Transcript_103455/g.316688  ORF Transcript_103455/g.316688 Transcript_103455/m.316688 type:complete len:262 (-) Transcript_103455:292-1077(-)
MHVVLLCREGLDLLEELFRLRMHLRQFDSVVEHGAFAVVVAAAQPPRCRGGPALAERGRTHVHLDIPVVEARHKVDPVRIHYQTARISATSISSHRLRDDLVPELPDLREFRLEGLDHMALHIVAAVSHAQALVHEQADIAAQLMHARVAHATHHGEEPVLLLRRKRQRVQALTLLREALPCVRAQLLQMPVHHDPHLRLHARRDGALRQRDDIFGGHIDESGALEQLPRRHFGLQYLYRGWGVALPDADGAASSGDGETS